MRILIATSLLSLMVAGLAAQPTIGGDVAFAPQILLPVVGAAGAGCTTPAGTTLTESFGDSGSLTCPDGTAGCNTGWTRVGSVDSIIASPGTPPANTACGKSLNLTQTGSTAGYLYDLGWLPTVPNVAGQTITVATSYYWHTDSLADNGNQQLISLGNTIGAGNSTCEMYVKKVNSTTRVLRARDTTSGGSVTANIALAQDTWFTPTLKCEIHGATNGSCVTDTNDLSCCAGGTETSHCKHFTAQNRKVTYVLVGDYQTEGAINHDLGNVAVSTDPSVGSVDGDSVFWDAETGSDTDALGVANITAMTKFGNGVWTQGAAGGFTISTTGPGNLPFANSVNVAGTTETGAGTRSIRYDYSSNTNGSWLYTFLSNSSQATVCYRWQADTDPGSYTASFNGIGNVTGDEFVNLNFNAGKVRLETASGANTGYSYSLNTPYYSCQQMNIGAGAKEKLWIWNGSTGEQVDYEERDMVVGVTNKPNHLSISRSDAAGAFTGSIWFDNFHGNYKGNYTPTYH